MVDSGMPKIAGEYHLTTGSRVEHMTAPSQKCKVGVTCNSTVSEVQHTSSS